LTPEAIVPVPHQVARRAWECAYDLVAEFSHRLQQYEREVCAWVVAKGSQRITWREAKAMFRLHRNIVGVRT